jgi:hypothetical protein
MLSDPWSDRPSLDIDNRNSDKLIGEALSTGRCLVFPLGKGNVPFAKLVLGQAIIQVPQGPGCIDGKRSKSLS